MSTKHIAIVDDEDEILNMLEKFLSRQGYKVTTYNNPLNAISSLSKETDLILLDIMMPQMNGLDALPKLRQKNSDVKILMMTAYSTLDKVLDAHRHGADEYVLKPFESLSILEKKIKDMLKS